MKICNHILYSYIRENTICDKSNQEPIQCQLTLLYNSILYYFTQVVFMIFLSIIFFSFGYPFKMIYGFIFVLNGIFM